MSRKPGSYDMYDAPFNIAKEWFKRGKREKNIVFAFVSYWITFNQLYNYYDMNGETYELPKIESFIDEASDIFTKCIDFDGKEISVFYDAPVLDANYRSPLLNWDHYSRRLVDSVYDSIGSRYSYSVCKRIVNDHIDFCNSDMAEITRIKILFKYIYKVRCNLFHGSKLPNQDRDLELVESSAIVLEKCLPDLIERIFGRRI